MRGIFLLLVTLLSSVSAFSAATNWKWKTMMDEEVRSPGSTSLLPSSTAYLFTSASIASVFSDWKAGKSVASSAGLLDSTSLEDGAISAKTFSYDAESLSTLFVAEYSAKDVSYLYVSTIKAADSTDIGSAQLYFEESATSQLAVNTSGVYGGAGWYSQSVPEPFSGALALVGLGVIGLRRKLKGKKQEKKA